jgi:hypothetical protein
MQRFEYKVLWGKKAGMLREAWFDGEQDLGPEIDSELLTGYGNDGWEVVATMQGLSGPTHKLILKRPRP